MFYKKKYIESQSDLVEAKKVLHEIKQQLMTHVEDRGWEWADHGTDDHDRVCYEKDGHYIGVKTRCWDLDGEEISLSKLLEEV